MDKQVFYTKYEDLELIIIVEKGSIEIYAKNYDSITVSRLSDRMLIDFMYSLLNLLKNKENKE